MGRMLMVRVYHYERIAKVNNYIYPHALSK